MLFPLRLDLLDSAPNGLVSYNFPKCDSHHFKLGLALVGSLEA